MRPDRRWLLVAAGVVVLAVVLTLALLARGDDGGGSIAIRATTTSTTQSADDDAPPTSLTVTSPAPTTAPTTATRPAATSPSPTTASVACPRPAPGSDFDGFGAAEIVIDDGEGSHRSCVLTADTSSQQERGLMRQNDLDGYDGMIFRFAKEEELAFWMRNTSIPLSIAFFRADGVFVSATDMEPCGDRSDCPVYRSGGPAKFALEVVKGQLPAAGATSGSRLGG